MEYNKRYACISSSYLSFSSVDERMPLYPKIRKEYQGNRLLGMTSSSYFFTLFVLLYLIFLCSGAALFSFIEAPEEKALKVRVKETIQQFLVANPTVTG